jgi:hypothetical protein
MAVASNTLTARGFLLLGAMRRNLELLVELEKVAPRDVQEIVLALIAHLRSWKPMAATAVPAPVLVVPIAAPDPEPVPTGELRRDLNDGANYRLDIVDDVLTLQVSDAQCDETVVSMTEAQGRTFRDDFNRLLAKLAKFSKETM